MVKGKVHLFLDGFLQKKIGVNGRLDNLHKQISFFLYMERKATSFGIYRSKFTFFSLFTCSSFSASKLSFLVND